MAADYVFVGDHDLDFKFPGTLGIIYNYKKWKEHKKGYPIFTATQYLNTDVRSSKMNMINIALADLSVELKNKIKKEKTAVLLIDTDNRNSIAEQRRLFVELINNKINAPVIIERSYKDLSEKQLQLSASTDIGALLLDGLGDGISIYENNLVSDQTLNSLSFGILQASRTRISKTEYISCPSCGRTLFDLQETTAKIRKETDHLKGVKIGIMGCIVNGPGEMADADYGYVGTGNGYISLYKGQEVVKRNIPTDGAVEALIGLIKEYGDWIDSATV